MSKVEIVASGRDDDRLAGIRACSAFDSVERGPIFGSFGRRYYPEAVGPNLHDLSFAVLVEGSPALLIDCDELDGTLGRYGFPVQIWPASEAPAAAVQLATTQAFRHLDELRDTHSLKQMQIANSTFGPAVSQCGKLALDRGARPVTKVGGVVDLNLDETELHRKIRKSYQSLINWGRKNLTLSYVDANDPDAAKFDEMRQFHLRIAGRSTRSELSWRLQYEACAAGAGEVALARDKDGELVAATMVIDGTADAVYFSAVYDREQFDLPLAHWPLYDALLRSKRRGRTRFVLGELPHRAEASAKEANIGYFKRGFATELNASLVWEWRRDWAA